MCERAMGGREFGRLMSSGLIRITVEYGRQTARVDNWLEALALVHFVFASQIIMHSQVLRRSTVTSRNLLYTLRGEM